MFILSSDHSTKIITFSNEHHTLNQTTQSIFETCCLHYGTTLQGSLQAIRFHLNIRQKCPVLLSTKHQLMFFPIPLANPQEKLWIRYLPSLISKRVSDHQCVVSFTHQNITLEVDNRMVVRQIKRCKSYVDKLNAYDLEYGLIYTEDSPMFLEDLLATTTLERKGFS
jgi:competence transcription factor ComK